MASSKFEDFALSPSMAKLTASMALRLHATPARDLEKQRERWQDLGGTHERRSLRDTSAGRLQLIATK